MICNTELFFKGIVSPAIVSASHFTMHHIFLSYLLSIKGTLHYDRGWHSHAKHFPILYVYLNTRTVLFDAQPKKSLKRETIAAIHVAIHLACLQDQAVYISYQAINCTYLIFFSFALKCQLCVPRSYPLKIHGRDKSTCNKNNQTAEQFAKGDVKGPKLWS